MPGVNALTSLADLKEYLRIDTTDTSEDTFLDKLIDRSTKRVEGFVNRLLRKRSYTEDYDGTGTPDLPLRQFPLVLLTEVNLDPLRTFGPITIIQNQFIVAAKETGILSLTPLASPATAARAVWTLGTRIIRVKYDGGFDPVPDDLALAAIKVAAMDFARAREGGDGINTETLAGRAINWIDGLPHEVAEMLIPYRRSA